MNIQIKIIENQIKYKYHVSKTSGNIRTILTQGEASEGELKTINTDNVQNLSHI